MHNPKMVMKSPVGKPMNPKSLGFISIRICKLNISNKIYQIKHSIYMSKSSSPMRHNKTLTKINQYGSI